MKLNGTYQLENSDIGCLPEKGGQHLRLPSSALRWQVALASPPLILRLRMFLVIAILLTLLPLLPSHVLLLHLPLVGLLVEILIHGRWSVLLLRRVVLLFWLVVLLVVGWVLLAWYVLPVGRVLLVGLEPPRSKCLSRLCILTCLFFVA